MTFTRKFIRRSSILTRGPDVNDDVVSDALSDDEKLNNPLPRKADRLPGEDMDDARSRYFSTLVNSKCRGPEREASN